jgi:hypothetical protein
MSPVRLSLAYKTILLVLMVTPQTFAGLFDRVLPPGLVPSDCNSQLDDAGMCFMQHDCRNECLPEGNLNSASRLSAALDFFFLPTDATDCVEFQEPICPLTETCCSVCRPRINSLYRCIVRKTPGLSETVIELQRTCPLNCKKNATAAAMNRTTGTGI